MVPDTSRWREDAAYDYFDELPPAGLAWECLRRNAAYQADYATLLKRIGDEERTTDLIGTRWGLRFRCPSKRRLGRPTCHLDSSKP